MRKSQAILEVTLIFIVGLFLFFGIMGIWMWGDNQIAKRQPPYNDTRVMAGTVNPLAPEDDPLLEGNKPIFWPLTESVHYVSSDYDYEYESTYEIEELSEQDVFGLQK